MVLLCLLCRELAALYWNRLRQYTSNSRIADEPGIWKGFLPREGDGYLSITPVPATLRFLETIGTRACVLHNAHNPHLHLHGSRLNGGGTR